MKFYFVTYLKLAEIQLKDFKVSLFSRNSVKPQHKTKLGHHEVVGLGRTRASTLDIEHISHHVSLKFGGSPYTSGEDAD